MEEASAEQLYNTYKSVMLGVAYRMLGSMMDAEDIVHDVFLSFNPTTVLQVENIKAYLCQIVINRSRDRIRSNSKKRETYVGQWLPEPVVWGHSTPDPSQLFERDELISTAYLVLLQQLSIVERTIFVLREVLQLSYAEIAGLVDKSSANCRQIFHRAKSRLNPNGYEDLRPGGLSAQDDQAHVLIDQFTKALTSGNLQTLVHILATEVTVYADGGGRSRTAMHPIKGFDRVVRFLGGVMVKLPEQFRFEQAVVNGLPGIVTYEGCDVSSVISTAISHGRITDLYIVVNSDKLRRVT